MRLCATLIAFALLAGCASLNEDACRTGDWYAVGFRDGTEGRSSEHIYRHARACNDYGIAPVRQPWEDGRQAGLPVYCTEERAWREGADGRRLSPVCPAEDLTRLARANDLGLSHYQVAREIIETERRIADVSSRLYDLPYDHPRRRKMIRERRALRHDLTRLRNERWLYRL
jgi:hypothetical protein